MLKAQKTLERSANQEEPMSTNRARISWWSLVMILSLVALGGVAPDASAATCVGADPCNACKNCHYCKRCAKDGKTCGICKKDRGVIGLASGPGVITAS